MKPDLAAAIATLELLEARLAQETAERQRFADFFQFAPEAYVITRADGAIADANLAAAELLGASREILVRKPLIIFIPLRNRPQFRRHLQSLGNAGKDGAAQWPTWLHRVRMPAGEAVEVEVSVRAIGDPAVGGFCWRLQRR